MNSNSGIARSGHFPDGLTEQVNRSMDSNEYPVRFSPDGLTEQRIDALLREVEGVVAARPRSGSLVLLDGASAQRWYRRRARRSVVAVVRALPHCGPAGGPDGWAA